MQNKTKKTTTNKTVVTPATVDQIDDKSLTLNFDVSITNYKNEALFNVKQNLKFESFLEPMLLPTAQSTIEEAFELLCYKQFKTQLRNTIMNIIKENSMQHQTISENNSTFDDQQKTLVEGGVFDMFNTEDNGQETNTNESR